MSWHGGTAFDPQAAHLVSPQQTTPAAASPTIESGRKRKRSSSRAENGEADGGDASGGFAGSPASQANGKQRHQPGVKRACNDCRQQKVSQVQELVVHRTFGVAESCIGSTLINDSNRSHDEPLLIVHHADDMSSCDATLLLGPERRTSLAIDASSMV